ncbi:MAG: hypothetical protein ACRC0L_08060, partial [Angustibacter sp.]
AQRAIAVNGNPLLLAQSEVGIEGHGLRLDKRERGIAASKYSSNRLTGSGQGGVPIVPGVGGQITLAGTYDAALVEASGRNTGPVSGLWAAAELNNHHLGYDLAYQVELRLIKHRSYAGWAWPRQGARWLTQALSGRGARYFRPAGELEVALDPAEVAAAGDWPGLAPGHVRAVQMSSRMLIPVTWLGDRPAAEVRVLNPDEAGKLLADAVQPRGTSLRTAGFNFYAVESAAFGQVQDLALGALKADSGPIGRLLRGSGQAENVVRQLLSHNMFRARQDQLLEGSGYLAPLAPGALGTRSLRNIANFRHPTARPYAEPQLRVEARIVNLRPAGLNISTTRRLPIPVPTYTEFNSSRTSVRWAGGGQFAVTAQAAPGAPGWVPDAAVGLLLAGAHSRTNSEG